MTAATTTFSALAHGDSFKFADIGLVFAGGAPDDTFTKDGPFTFTSGKLKMTLDKVKTTKVVPVH